MNRLAFIASIVSIVEITTERTVRITIFYCKIYCQSDENESTSAKHILKA